MYNYPFSQTDENLIRMVWNKGKIANGYNPEFWRKDIFGFFMHFPDHGNTNSEYGWEIDHIIPSSKGGSDNLSNLQPLFWKNNRYKGDNYPYI